MYEDLIIDVAAFYHVSTDYLLGVESKDLVDKDLEFDRLLHDFTDFYIANKNKKS